MRYSTPTRDYSQVQNHITEHHQLPCKCDRIVTKQTITSSYVLDGLLPDAIELEQLGLQTPSLATRVCQCWQSSSLQFRFVSDRKGAEFHTTSVFRLRCLAGEVRGCHLFSCCILSALRAMCREDLCHFEANFRGCCEMSFGAFELDFVSGRASCGMDSILEY